MVQQPTTMTRETTPCHTGYIACAPWVPRPREGDCTRHVKVYQPDQDHPQAVCGYLGSGWPCIFFFALSGLDFLLSEVKQADQWHLEPLIHSGSSTPGQLPSSPKGVQQTQVLECGLIAGVDEQGSGPRLSQKTQLPSAHVFLGGSPRHWALSGRDNGVGKLNVMRTGATDQARNGLLGMLCAGQGQKQEDINPGI